MIIAAILLQIVPFTIGIIGITIGTIAAIAALGAGAQWLAMSFGHTDFQLIIAGVRLAGVVGQVAVLTIEFVAIGTATLGDSVDDLTIRAVSAAVDLAAIGRTLGNALTGLEAIARRTMTLSVITGDGTTRLRWAGIGVAGVVVGDISIAGRSAISVRI